jgi:DDE superfamily endonuclease
LTYAFTLNANRSEKLEPFIIGKAYKPQAFGRKTGQQLGFDYSSNIKT